MTIIWWDPEFVGVDELSREGPGMYQFVDGGQRYLSGEIPTEPLAIFDPSVAVATYDEIPPGEGFADYEPLRPAG